MKIPITTLLLRGMTLLCLISLICLYKPDKARSQVLKVLASNTFSGTINGAILGGATMALTNNGDYAPIRFGVGMGTLTGMGVGIYDVSNNPGYIQGTFNTLSNSGYVILIDTFYGAATGTVVGVAISLLGNNRIIQGAQYGVGAGAWGGFAFGLVDAFYLSQSGPNVDYFSNKVDRSSGLIKWQTGHNSQVEFINPSIYNFPELSDNSLTINSYLGFEVAKISMNF